MTTATMTNQTVPLTSKHSRLVSFEPSHSWLKRCDSEGLLIIQGGYKLNPQGRFKKDDENPHTIFDGQSRHYGAVACLGDHESALNQRKELSARHAFAACLRPSDDGQDLIVVVSHWNEDRARTIGESLKGQYRLIRNGIEIKCTVKEVGSQLEDEGTYQLLKPQLKPGRTLLIGSGHGTSQEWIVESDGFIGGVATENLAVSQLVKTIANDAVIRGHALKLGEQQVNLDSITQALRTGEYGSMPREHWEAIKDRYVGQWYESFKNYLLKTYGSDLQSISNIVFSGGGAELIRDRVGKFAIIPIDAQTSSVRGAYQHHAAAIGVM